jgi:hypothetical protein
MQKNDKRKKTKKTNIRRIFFETIILDSKSELWYISKLIQIDKSPLTYSQTTKFFQKKSFVFEMASNTRILPKIK